MPFTEASEQGQKEKWKKRTSREQDRRGDANHEHANQREHMEKLKQDELKPPRIIIAPPTGKEPTDRRLRKPRLPPTRGQKTKKIRRVGTDTLMDGA